jgi:hypothetical protein
LCQASRFRRKAATFHSYGIDFSVKVIGNPTIGEQVNEVLFVVFREGAQEN